MLRKVAIALLIYPAACMHDVGSLVPVLTVTVMFVLPAARNLANLHRANM